LANFYEETSQVFRPKSMDKMPRMKLKKPSEEHKTFIPDINSSKGKFLT
jgi:hypothetical protein